MIDTYVILHSTEVPGPQGNVHFVCDRKRDNMAKKCNRAIDEFLSGPAEWLCIRHADVEIRCDDSVVESQLNQLAVKRVGVAGLIGTLALGETLQWWSNYRPAVTVGAIIQGYSDGSEVPMLDLPDRRSDLASVDGCCLWISRRMLNAGVRFDGKIPGWHCYDADFCLSTLFHGYKVGLVNVCAKHSSEGHFEVTEMSRCQDYVLNKWKKLVSFPVVSGVTKWGKNV